MHVESAQPAPAPTKEMFHSLVSCKERKRRCVEVAAIYG